MARNIIYYFKDFLIKIGLLHRGSTQSCILVAGSHYTTKPYLVSEVYLLSTNSTDEKGEHIFSVINEKVIRIKQRFQLVAHTFMKAKKYYHV